MVIKIDYTSSDVYVSTSVSPVYVVVNYSGVSGGGVWGQITGTLSDQTDLQDALDDKVPYTGATNNVDLGEYELKAGQVEFDQSPTGTAGVAVMRWNDTDGTVDLGLKGGNVTLQLGQELVQRVVNKSGANLLESAYQVVKVTDAQGQRLAVDLAQGNNDANSTDTLGIVTETINNNQEGFITISGIVRNINTTGSLQGETWADGDVLYLSPITAGAITNIKPIAPNHTVVLGYVVYAHANNGKIFTKCDNGYEIGELHDCYLPSPSNNDGIFWNTANSRYQNNTIAGALGYTPVPTTRQLTINGTAYDLSSDRSWSVGTVTSITLATGTTGTDVNVSNGTITSSGTITLNIPDASATARGLVTTGTQTIAGAKTFSDEVTSTNFVLSGGTGNTGLYFGHTDKVVLANYVVGGGIDFQTNGGAINMVLDASANLSVVGNITGASIIKSGGTSSQFLKADGSVDSSTYYLASNPSAYIPLTALSASSPLSYNNLTGAFTIAQSSGSQNGYLNSTDWTTFNNKQNALTNPVTGTGTSGQVAYWNGTGSQTGSNNLFWDATNARLGIGTATPAFTLEVSGTAKVSGLTQTGLLGVNREANSAVGIYIKGSGTTSSSYNILGTNSAGGNLYTFLDDGTLVLGGISKTGTSTLQVVGGNVSILGSGNWYELNNSLGAGIKNNNGDFYIDAISSTANIYFRTGSSPSERARITAAGRLLLGTTSESTYLLDVASNARIGGALTISASNLTPTTTADVLTITSGYTTPDIGRIFVGDGTGWRLNFSKRRFSVTTDLVIISDNGDVDISGVLRETITTNRQTASYSLVLTDRGKLVEMNVASANNLTVPLNSSIAFPVGTKIDIAQYGAGQTTVVATSGVTVRSAGGALKLTSQYSGATLVKIATDEWYLFGNITT